MVILIVSFLNLAYANLFIPSFLEFNEGHYKVFNKEEVIDSKELRLDQTSIKNQYQFSPILEAEDAQRVYSLNEQAYVDHLKGIDFLTAKIKHQQSLNWDHKNLRMIQDFTLTDWMGLSHPPLKNLDQPIEFYDSSFNQVSPNTDFKNFEGGADHNQVKVLQNLEITEEKIKLFNQAQESIMGSVMLIRCDAGTIRFIESLAGAVKRGVQVDLIVDKTFDLLDNKFCSKKIKKLGINLAFANESTKQVLKEFFSDNGHRSSPVLHAKYWIVDRKQAIVDGTNIIDAEVLSTGFNHLYHDFGVLVEGEVVNQIQKTFINFYNRYSKKQIEYKPVTFNPKMGNARCAFLFQEPQKNSQIVGQTLLKLVQQSKQSIMLSTLEYAFDFSDEYPLIKDFYQELIAKSKSNVRIDLIMNDHNTPWAHSDLENVDLKNPRKQLMGNVLKNYFAKKLPSNLKTQRNFLLKNQNQNFRSWYHFQFFHGKLVLIDHSLFSIGSHNLNERSFSSDIETSLVCYDPAEGKKLARILTQDLVNSSPVVRGINEK